MKAYKCDRCGSFYEKYSMTGGLIIINRNYHSVDICPACYEEFEKWYKNEQVLQEDIPDCKYCKWIGSPEPISKCKTCIRGSNFEVSKAFITADEEGKSDNNEKSNN